MKFLIQDINSGSLSYEYNDLVERQIASILSAASGLQVSDFGIGIARPEYDFRIGEMPIELKITGGGLVPIEVAKDNELKVLSGLSTTTAAWFIYLMDGMEGKIGCGKFRAYSTKALRSAISRKKVGGYPRFYPGATPSQSALVHHMHPFNITDVWLGNCDKMFDEKGYTLGYDLDTWRDAGSDAGSGIRNMVEQYHQDIADGEI